MPTLHIMLSNDITRQRGPQAEGVFRGLYGEMTPNGFVIADEIRPISHLFNLMGSREAPIPCAPNDVLAINIEDESMAQALKHHLLMTSSANWSSLYAMVTGSVPESMRAALAADENLTRTAMRKFAEDRNLREFDVPVTYYAVDPGDNDASADFNDGDDGETVDDRAIYFSSVARSRGLEAATTEMLARFERLLDSVRYDSTRSVTPAPDESDIQLDTIAQPEEPPMPVPQLRAVTVSATPPAVSRDNLRQMLQQRRGITTPVEPELPAWTAQPLSNLSLFVNATARVSAVDEAQAAGLVNLLSNLPNETLQRTMLKLEQPSVVAVEIINETDADTAGGDVSVERPRAG